MKTLKICAAILTLLAIAMFVIGIQMAGSLTINAPIVTGIGFLVIAYAFYSHKH